MFEGCTRETRDKNNEGAVLVMQGQVAHAAGDYRQARARYAEVVALEEEHGGNHQDGFGYPLLLALAQLAVATGKQEKAARQFGALPKEPEAGMLAAGFSTSERLDYEIATLRVQLGESVFAAATAEGRAMTIE